MAYNYLDKTGLALLWEKVKNQLSGKVDKETGKGLSSNDYTSDEKAKLANIEVGAQANVLEGIQKNGVDVTTTNKIANISVPTKVSELNNDSKFQTESDVQNAIDAAITTVMDYKGTKATVADLPKTGNKNGDVWHVTETDGEYAWSGTEREEIGSTIDFSGYVQTSDMAAITSSEINTICV